MSHKVLDHLLSRAQHGLNSAACRQAAWQALFISSCLGVALASTWVLSGAAVPISLPLICLLLALLLWPVLWWWRSVSRATTAQLLDQHFQLRDGLVSHAHLPDQTGFPTVARQRIADDCQDLDLNRLPQLQSWSGRGWSLLLAVALTALCLLPESAQRQRERQQQASEQAQNQEQAQVLDSLLDDLDLPERKTYEHLLAELRQSDNREQALRMLALMEQQASQHQQQLDPRADLQLLARLGEKLSQADVHANKQLGQALTQGLTGQAGELVQQLQQDLDNDAPLNEASQQQLRELGSQLTHNTPQDAGRAAALAEQLRQLGDQLRKLSAAEKHALSEAKRLGEVKPASLAACKVNRNGACQGLDAIDAVLQGLKKRKKGSELLAMLRQGIARCQGKNPGTGAGERQLSQAKQRPDPEGGLAQARLQDTGQGESSIRILEAASGSGQRQRVATEQQHDYQAQLESFISREDVPATLRHSVRQYFITIHHLDTPVSTPAIPSPDIGAMP